MSKEHKIERIAIEGSKMVNVAVDGQVAVWIALGSKNPGYPVTVSAATSDEEILRKCGLQEGRRGKWTLVKTPKGGIQTGKPVMTPAAVKAAQKAIAEDKVAYYEKKAAEAKKAVGE